MILDDTLPSTARLAEGRHLDDALEPFSVRLKAQIEKREEKTHKFFGERDLDGVVAAIGDVVDLAPRHETAVVREDEALHRHLHAQFVRLFVLKCQNLTTALGETTKSKQRKAEYLANKAHALFFLLVHLLLHRHCPLLLAHTAALKAETVVASKKSFHDTAIEN